MRCFRFVAALLLFPLFAFGAGLSKKEKEILRNVDTDLPRTLSLVERAVNIDSATQNLRGVRAVADLFAPEFQEIGFAPRWIAMPEGTGRAGHLFAEREGHRGRRLLLIGHLDTVLEGSHWTREGDTAHGNGTVDMKAGDVIVIAALRALERAGALNDRRIVVAFTGDEEDPGKPISVTRGDLIEAGHRSDIALAFEASVGDTGTIARRGVTQWRLDVEGETGHSAGIFDASSGAGAIFEAGRILNGFYDELKGEKYLTFNPSVVVGGTDVAFEDEPKKGTAGGKTNVIPKKVVVEGDLRFISEEQRERTKQRMNAIVAKHLPRTNASIVFTDLYPAMAPTDGNHAVLAVLDQASRDLGYGAVPPLDPGERGGGDISFVAFIDGLDGLGAKGDGSHTPNESADLGSLPKLIKRTAILIYRLTR